MKKKATLIIALALALSLMLSGCSKSSLDGTETAATLDDTTTVSLGEINLMLRYEQAQMETYYGSWFGSNVYAQDLYGTGTVYGESAKEALLTEFEELYILEAEAPGYGVELTEDEKAAAAEAARNFIAANTDDVIEAIGVNQEMVEHVLTLMTLSDKMYDALTADVDTEVSDDEAAQKKIAYIYISTSGTEQDEDGNTIELTDEEKAEKKAALQAVLDAGIESGDLAAAAEEQDNEEIVSSSTTYGADSTTPAEELRTAADALAEGEFTEIVETDYGYYAAQMISLLDRDATDAQKETIVQERRDALYSEKYEELQAAHTFTTNADALAKLTFDRAYKLMTEE